MRWLAALLGGLSVMALSACGPSLSSLVRDKHYREALCAAVDGDEDDARLVGEALDADAGLFVHVHVASADELRPALEAATDPVLERARLVRVSAQSNVLPIDAMKITALLTAEGGKLAAVPADWTTLAWATQEKLPPKRTEKTYVTGENVLKGGAALFTFGFSLLFTDFEPAYVEVDAPLSEFEAMAPLASRLQRTTSRGGCQSVALSSSGAGQRCTFYFLLDNVSRSPVTLEVSARYASERKRASDAPGEEQTCAVLRRFRMELGPPSGIEAATRGWFGTTMKPVREVMRGQGSSQ